METLTFTPTLLLDLVVDICCRLPVKLLLQIRCLSKYFNSLISYTKFANKHLQLSIKSHHLMVCSRNNLGEFPIFNSTMSSALSTSAVMQTQLHYPITRKNGGYGYRRPLGLSSCDDSFVFPLVPILRFCGNIPLENLSYCLLWKAHQQYFCLPYLTPSMIISLIITRL